MGHLDDIAAHLSDHRRWLADTLDAAARQLKAARYDGLEPEAAGYLYRVAGSLSTIAGQAREGRRVAALAETRLCAERALLALIASGRGVPPQRSNLSDLLSRALVELGTEAEKKRRFYEVIKAAGARRGLGATLDRHVRCVGRYANRTHHAEDLLSSDPAPLLEPAMTALFGAVCATLRAMDVRFEEGPLAAGSDPGPPLLRCADRLALRSPLLDSRLDSLRRHLSAHEWLLALEDAGSIALIAALTDPGLSGDAPGDLEALYQRVTELDGERRRERQRPLFDALTPHLNALLIYRHHPAEPAGPCEAAAALAALLRVLEWYLSARAPELPRPALAAPPEGPGAKLRSYLLRFLLYTLVDSSPARGPVLDDLHLDDTALHLLLTGREVPYFREHHLADALRGRGVFHRGHTLQEFLCCRAGGAAEARAKRDLLRGDSDLGRRVRGLLGEYIRRLGMVGTWQEIVHGKEGALSDGAGKSQARGTMNGIYAHAAIRWSRSEMLLFVKSDFEKTIWDNVIKRAQADLEAREPKKLNHLHAANVFLGDRLAEVFRWERKQARRRGEVPRPTLNVIEGGVGGANNTEVRAPDGALNEERRDPAVSDPNLGYMIIAQKPYRHDPAAARRLRLYTPSGYLYAV